MSIQKLGLGGGCHWCTEAIFNQIKGVQSVEQGWLNTPDFPNFSEGISILFDSDHIDLTELIKIHLLTHSSGSNHPLRSKYRSAVYVTNEEQRNKAQLYINQFQKQHDQPIITKVLYYGDFKLNQSKYLNYYDRHQGNVFCERYIDPKLDVLHSDFSHLLKK